MTLKNNVLATVGVVAITIASLSGCTSSTRAASCTPTWTKECPSGSAGPNLHYRDQQEAKRVLKILKG